MCICVCEGGVSKATTWWHWWQCERALTVHTSHRWHTWSSYLTCPVTWRRGPPPYSYISVTNQHHVISYTPYLAVDLLPGHLLTPLQIITSIKSELKTLQCVYYTQIHGVYITRHLSQSPDPQLLYLQVFLLVFLKRPWLNFHQWPQTGSLGRVFFTRPPEYGPQVC